jgi:hypothetical protein
MVWCGFNLFAPPLGFDLASDCKYRSQDFFFFRSLDTCLAEHLAGYPDFQIKPRRAVRVLPFFLVLFAFWIDIKLHSYSFHVFQKRLYSLADITPICLRIVF